MNRARMRQFGQKCLIVMVAIALIASFLSLFPFKELNTRIESNSVLKLDKLPQKIDINALIDIYSVPKSSDLSESFGFELCFTPEGGTYNEAPEIAIKIIDPVVVAPQNYWVQFTTELGYTGLRYQFDPQDSANKALLNENFTMLWDATAEAVLMTCTVFNSTENTYAYSISCKKDLTAPQLTMNFVLLDEYHLEPFDQSDYYFRLAPSLYLNISDNIENQVTIFYSLNSELYSAVQRVAPHGADLISQALLIITLPDWENIPEGKHTMVVYVNDTAGNVASIKTIHFIKDTIAPALASGITGQSWLMIGEQSLADLENPVYGTYVVNKKPNFYFTFNESSIESVCLYCNLSDIGLPDVPQSSSASPIYGDTRIEAIRKTNSAWELSLSYRIWNAIGEDPFSMLILIKDHVGNPTIFVLTLEKGENYQELGGSSTFIHVFYLVAISVVTSIIALAINARRAKYRPLEQDFNKIDPDLLDAVLSPINAVKTDSILKYSANYKPGDKMERIAPPDLQEFLKTPVQAVNLKEIHELLSLYKMDPLKQEDFIREMLAMSPSERLEFLKKYMSPDSNEDENSDEI